MNYFAQQEVSNINKMKRGGIIYHGSTSKIKELEPRFSPVINRKGVFAGPKWIAVSFCGKWRDLDMEQGTIDGVPYIREKTPNGFKKIYGGGGYLHELRFTDDFWFDDRLGPYEVYSDRNVFPLNVVFIKDPVEEMRKLGVKIYYYGERND